MRLVFMGTPDFVVPVLEALATAPNVEVVGVFTPPDRPKGRGRPTEMSPVKGYALSKGLPVYQPATLRSVQVQNELAGLGPDVVVVAAYGKLLPPQVLRTPLHGCLNLHPSLLPRYRGATPVAAAILDAEAVTGMTLMLLDEGMDTGPIVGQLEYPLSGAETAEALTASLFQLGAGLLLDSLDPWVAGQLTAQPQDESRATTTGKLERTDGLADWALPAAALERRCRAYTPWPGLFTHWEGKVLKLLDVVPLPQEAAPMAKPGQVAALSAEEPLMGVGTGAGILGLRRVQLEGRRAATIEEFLRGYTGFVGSRL